MQVKKKTKVKGQGKVSFVCQIQLCSWKKYTPCCQQGETLFAPCKTCYEHRLILTKNNRFHFYISLRSLTKQQKPDCYQSHCWCSDVHLCLLLIEEALGSGVAGLCVHHKQGSHFYLGLFSSRKNTGSQHFHCHECINWHNYFAKAIVEPEEVTDISNKKKSMI